MPFSTPFPLRPIDSQEFAALDYQVMSHTFSSQNELGRLCDGVIYQNDLAARLRGTRLGVIRTQVPISVLHQDFSKTYFLDLVVDDSVSYEIKTVTQFVPEHEAQLLNYLCLGGVNHDKLINFRTGKVESWFVNTNLTHKTRRQCRLNTRRWQEKSEASQKLRIIMTELLKDWVLFCNYPFTWKRWCTS